MAHNINRNINTGKDAFFSVKEKAWHALGTIVQDYPTSAEAIQYAGLDYHVEKRELFTPNKAAIVEGTEEVKALLDVANYYATVRTDTNQVLGVVGNKYEVVQNKDAFVFFDSLVTDGSGIEYETAGALGNGERIFITAKLPDVMRIGRAGKDVIELYIFLTTSHDGSGSIIAAITPVRIVCANTLRRALNDNTDQINIRHTANAEQAMKEAARIITIAESENELLTQAFNNWSKIKINDRELKKLIRLSMSPNKEVFKAVVTDDKAFEFSRQFDEVCGQVFEYAMVEPSQQMETTAGTLFGGYNAITGYYQNVKTYTSKEKKINSIMFGTGFERTKKAFEICTKANDFLN